MMEQLITKETAIVAKEKGFDEPCTYLWGVVGGYEGQHNWDNINHLCNEKQFSAPTQTELQSWFRRIHGIEIYVKPFYIPQLNREGCFKYYGMVSEKELVTDCIVSTECCDVYEVAFEGALILALNLLKK